MRLRWLGRPTTGPARLLAIGLLGIGLLGIGLLGIGLAALTAPAASAHNTLISVSPANGSTVARVPSVFVLTFDEPALTLGTKIVITGPAGPLALAPSQFVDTTVRQPLPAGSPAGAYRVEWRVTSVDGHPVTGRSAFSASAAGGSSAPGSTPTPPPTPVSGAGPAWAIGGVILVLLLGALTSVLVLRWRHRPPAAP